MFEQLLKAFIQKLQKDTPVMKLYVPPQEADRIPEKNQDCLSLIDRRSLMVSYNI